MAYSASKFCPHCKRRFPLSESRCTICRSTDINGHTLPQELWTVVAMPGGKAWQHYPPEALNDAALQRLAQKNTAPSVGPPDAA